MQNYFWPGACVDIYVVTVDQLFLSKETKKGKTPKAKVVPIPKFDVPLSRVAIGCVGPVPMTEKKHHTYQRSPGHLKEAKEKPTNKQF